MTDRTNADDSGAKIERDDYGRSDAQAANMGEGMADSEKSGGTLSPGDYAAGGGSSGLDGYTQSNADRPEGGETGSAGLRKPHEQLSRGEAFDQEQGGGRGRGSVG